MKRKRKHYKVKQQVLVDAYEIWFHGRLVSVVSGKVMHYEITRTFNNVFKEMVKANELDSSYGVFTPLGFNWVQSRFCEEVE